MFFDLHNPLYADVAKRVNPPKRSHLFSVYLYTPKGESKPYTLLDCVKMEERNPAQFYQKLRDALRANNCPDILQSVCECKYFPCFDQFRAYAKDGALIAYATELLP